ncbi:MAG: hypothetical protein ACFFG0_08115 [Candidatus Thorarchaeota archaeon]
MSENKKYSECCDSELEEDDWIGKCEICDRWICYNCKDSHYKNHRKENIEPLENEIDKLENKRKELVLVEENKLKESYGEDWVYAKYRINQNDEIKEIDKSLITLNNELIELTTKRYIKIKGKNGKILFETEFKNLKDIKIEFNCTYKDLVGEKYAVINSEMTFMESLFTIAELLQDDDY